jgi:hypothetical protein
MATDLETNAATVTQDSAPVITETSAFDSTNQHTWSSEQRAEWNRTGVQPVKADSATAKDAAAPDPAPDKKDKKTASASDSATEKDTQKPHLKTKEDTERRIQQLLDENKTLRERADATERAKSEPEKRDVKQFSQPAPETYKRLDEKEFFTKNPKATYEDYIDAAVQHGAEWKSKQVVSHAIAEERQRLAQAEAQKQFQVKAKDARERYPDLDEKVPVAFKSLVEDPQIPGVIKAMLDDSDVLLDVMYVLGSDPTELAQFVQLAKTNPGAALRKLVTTESLVKEKLSGKSGKSETVRGEDGKFVKADATKDDAAKPARSESSAELKPRAPKPPSEVGGRGTAPEDTLRTAAQAGDFTAFEAGMNARRQARAKA